MIRPSALGAAIALAACSPEARTSTAAETPVGAPWTLAAVVPDTTDGVRILLIHDMEGLSGQTDPRTFDFKKPQYQEGQLMLAADVNAVIEGLFAGGATDVEVVDGHGSGNPAPDVRRDLLDPRAEQIIRDEEFDAYLDLVTPNRYDAVVAVGMHAKTGSGGFASHTITLGIGVLLNGQSITETELVAASWGRVGVPVILASGDDRLAADLATMPWIEFVTVKKALAADSALPRPASEAHADLTAAARRAVENLKAGKTLAIRTSTPLMVGLKAVPPASLSFLEGVPGVRYADSTVTFPADSFAPAYHTIEKLIGVAALNYFQVTLPATVGAAPDGGKTLERFADNLFGTWFDYESGRWAAPRRPPIAADTKYHGYR